MSLCLGQGGREASTNFYRRYINGTVGQLGVAMLAFGMVAALAPAPVALAAATAAPAWAPIAVSGPTVLPPGGEGTLAVYVQNVGGAASSGTITVEDELPPGLTVSAAVTGEGWGCTLPGPSAVTCVTTQSVASGTASSSIKIPVSVAAGPLKSEINRLTVAGGGAVTPIGYEEPITISTTPAKPGAQAFTAGFFGPDGSSSTQAGSHPYLGTFAVFINTVTAPGGGVVPAGNARTIAVGMPPGLLGNVAATPGCVEGVDDHECPLETQVGIAQSMTEAFGATPELSAVHSVKAPIGYPAKLTFSPAGLLQMDAVSRLRSEEDYGINVEIVNAPEIKPIYGAFVVLWGVPADSGHDELRCESPSTHQGCGPGAANHTAFLTLPTDCGLQAAEPPFVELSFDTWQAAGDLEQRLAPVPAVSGCEHLAFDADFALGPKVTQADSPAAFEAKLTAPDEGLADPSKLAAPEIRKTVIKLPRGVALSASAADGLGACSEQQIGLKNEIDSAIGVPKPLPPPTPIRFSEAPNRCPDSSKIGTGEVRSPLLENSLKGSLYLAAQGKGNPFGSLFAVYLVVEDQMTGVVIKLPGEVAVNEQTGQMTIAFEDLPQIPFTSLKLDLKGGSRAPLATPGTCGTFATAAATAPWSAPESGPPVVSEDSFEIDTAPGGVCANTAAQRPFALGFDAGSTHATAGAHSPFTAQITRPDGAQELDSLEIAMPPGLAASLRAIPYCAEAQIRAAEASTGTAERASPACPAASQVGTTVAGAGAGSSPFYASGNLYLAGPYKGAPLSLVAITPGLAGPFDLGNLVVRSALYVDPISARLTAKTDPIPQFLKGIQLRVREIRISLDRPNWVRNPTSCEPTAVEVTAHGNSGAVSRLSNRFQVGGCEALGFRPKLSLRFLGQTHRSAHPKLRAVLSTRNGDANIARASVTLPKTEFLENSHIKGICARSRFAAGDCPAGSIYGHAKAWTPLLDQPLEGPLYLRASDRQLPDLVASLDGQIHIDLAGRINSVRGRIRATFDTVPDAPLSKFVLTMDGGRKGLLVNNTELCKAKSRASAVLRAQNGKSRAVESPMRLECGARKARLRHVSFW